MFAEIDYRPDPLCQPAHHSLFLSILGPGEFLLDDSADGLGYASSLSLRDQLSSEFENFFQRLHFRVLPFAATPIVF